MVGFAAAGDAVGRQSRWEIRWKKTCDEGFRLFAFLEVAPGGESLFSRRPSRMHTDSVVGFDIITARLRSRQNPPKRQRPLRYWAIERDNADRALFRQMIC